MSKEFAYVYTCYDPAITEKLYKILVERFGAGNFFFASDPGAVKNLVTPRSDQDTDFVLWKMKLAQEFHPFTTLILVNHSDCGAYKKAGLSFADPKEEEAFHAEQLRRAEFILREHFPEVPLEIHYFDKKNQRMLW